MVDAGFGGFWWILVDLVDLVRGRSGRLDWKRGEGMPEHHTKERSCERFSYKLYERERQRQRERERQRRPKRDALGSHQSTHGNIAML